MQKVTFINLLYDSSFKYLLKNSKTRKFYERVIKKYTGIDLAGYTFVDSEFNTIIKGDSKIDTLLMSNDGKKLVNIEMNNYNCLRRNEKYLHLISIDLYKREEEKKIEADVYQINFNSFLSVNSVSDIKEHIALRDENSKIRIENFQIFNINLDKNSNKCYTDSNNELKLLMSTSYEEMEDVIASEEDIEIRKEMTTIMEEAKKMSKNKSFLSMYTYEDSRRDIENDIRRSARKEGLSEGKMESARNMLADGLTFDKISQYTGLSTSTIKSLK